MFYFNIRNVLYSTLTKKDLDHQRTSPMHVMKWMGG
jgi:hypothetical protein